MVLGLAEGLSAMDWLLLSVLLGVVSWVLHRPQQIARRTAKQESLDVMERFGPKAEIEAQLGREMGLKLVDMERDVDGRMQTRLAVLDQLILDADRKIELLQKTLDELRSAKGSRGYGEIVIFPQEAVQEDTTQADAA